MFEVVAPEVQMNFAVSRGVFREVVVVVVLWVGMDKSWGAILSLGFYIWGWDGGRARGSYARGR